MPKTAKQQVLLPLTERVFRKDDPAKQTKGGIALPDGAEQETLTGRIVAVSPDLADKFDFPVKQYDKVVVDPSNAVPVELAPDNKLWLLPYEDVMAVFQNESDDAST